MNWRRFIIVSGLSGAGKTVALHALEDSGFYCVDNLPAGFLAEFAHFIEGGDLPHYRKVAVGIDARNPASDLSQFPRVLDDLRRMELDVQLLFIDASEETLMSRFSETRRKHPLSSDEQPLHNAIAQERVLLEPLAAEADLRIDTTRSQIHEFRTLIGERVAKEPVSVLSLQVCSFGYKNGVPPDTDFVFDLRCLPNPYWDPLLRELSGRDQAVRDFLDENPAVEDMVSDIIVFFEKWIPRFEAENRSYLTVALGCTGGRHRSIYVAERVANHFRTYRQILLNHRDG